MIYLNIGCGKTFHKDWVNLDLTSSSPEVTACDLRKGLPFSDASVDACYSSHVLEHLSEENAKQFIAEQWRVLKPGGIIRVVVPDVETICRNYLRYLEELVSGNTANEFRYDYSLLEMYDQTTRTVSGGRMAKIWESDKIDKEFVRSRHGNEFERAVSIRRSGHSGGRRGILETLEKLPGRIRMGLLKLLVGPDMASSIRVRLSGELHLFMYDRYSLGRLLTRCGFDNVCVSSAEKSFIENYSKYNLDSVSGELRKPDSLFMEAKKSVLSKN